MNARSDAPDFCRGSPSAARAVWSWNTSSVASQANAVAPAGSSLRRDGLVRGVIGLLAGAAIFLWWHTLLAVVVFTLATITLLLALLSPGGGYRRLHGALAVFARWVGLLIGWVLLPLFFFAVLTPLALLLRLGTRDRLRQRREPGALTYWSTRVCADRRGADPYRRQF